MLRIMLTLTALAGLAGAVGLNRPAYSDHDDDDGARRRVIIRSGTHFAPPVYRGYKVDDDDGGHYHPVPVPYAPNVDLRWQGGSVYIAPNRVHIQTYRQHPQHNDFVPPPPPYRHDEHHDPGVVPPPPAIDESPDLPPDSAQHTFPGPRIPGVHDGGAVPPPPVVEQPRQRVVVPPVVVPQIDVPQTEAGRFVEGDAPLYARVKVNDIEDAHPRAVPRILAVRHPDGPGPVFVKVLAPPFPPSEVDTDDDNRKIKLEWDDYSVEVESDDGRIEIDYDN
jgi:hypothetical protein